MENWDFLFFVSRFQFTREEIQAFREEHEQRNGDLTKPEEDSSTLNTRQSSLKRPIDLHWSVNLKEPLPSTTLNGHQSIETLNNHTPIDVLRETKNIDNPNYDQFTYQFVIQSISSSFCFFSSSDYSLNVIKFLKISKKFFVHLIMMFAFYIILK